LSSFIKKIKAKKKKNKIKIKASQNPTDSKPGADGSRL
jgi:hypothetical protein